MTNPNNTICALATPNGVGALAIIRVSGQKTLSIVSNCFSKNLVGRTSHTAHYGFFKNNKGELIDEVLITVFENGKSFTGEESAEIACHASPYIQQQIIVALIEAGCTLAEPGEYTMRAFMNGKLDLSQAEAVADLIASQSKSAHDIALKQLRGGFSNELKDLRERLIHFASLVELELDFAEEDVEFADRRELLQLVTDVLQYIQRLSKSFELGNAIKNGVPVAIVGAPNTGKSTLLNQLLGEERAIVSNIAGTTRDVIEETLNIEGILFRLIDTAGIREGAEEIEAMGIERSLEKIGLAKIVLCLADTTLENSLEEVTNWANEIIAAHPDKKVLIVANKVDVSENLTQLSAKPIEVIGTDKRSERHTELVEVSAKQGLGIDQLREKLVSMVIGDFNMANETIVSNVRHYDALRRTAESLEKAKYNLENNITADWVAMDIRQAMYDLGTITGDISTDDLLGNIFSKFCIGK